MIRVEKFYPLMLEAFEENKTFSFPVKGTSMRPFLKNGDIVTLKKFDGNAKIGDVLFYRRDDMSFVLHRVRKIKNNKLYIVGDHQTPLEEVSYDKIIATTINYKKSNKDKIYNMKGIKYSLYKFIVKFKIIRYIFAHIYK